MSGPAKPPFDWSRLIPDTRSLVTLGMLALAWRLLEMVDAEPALLKDAAFMTLATLVLGSGGIGAAVNFFYGSSRGAEQQATQTAALASAVVAQNPPTPTEPTTSVSVTQPADAPSPVTLSAKTEPPQTPPSQGATT